MANKYDFFIGIDPGISGGFAVISKNDAHVYKMPIEKVSNPNKKAKIKTKSSLDINKIIDILKPYQNKKVLVSIEKVHAMKSQGTVSMFNFGMSYGIYKGIIYTLGFDVLEVSPQTWKKFFPELDLSNNENKEKIKKMQLEMKQTKDKLIKKEIDRLNAKVKKEAKSLARKLAAEKFPSIKDEFNLVQDDGKADASLLALYAKQMD